jgi:tRNA 2-thiouridine synthesizing protein B
LIEDGVYAALANAEFANKITSRLDNFSFYVLGPDVAARGLSDTPLIGDISVVDYEGFVDLVADNDVTQSWL